MIRPTLQGVEQIVVRLGREQIGELRKTISDRRQRGHAVVLAAQMRAGARPASILCPRHQSRPHRIERHVAQRRREMLFVHGNSAEPALPEMSGAPTSRMDDPGARARAHATRL